jgi:Skp family chaperone for outer membrane proteins
MIWDVRMRSAGSRHPRALLGAALLLAVVIGTAGCTSGQIGVVDSRRILTESAKALRYQKQIDDRERAMTTDLQLLVSQLSKEDLDARRTQYLRELQTMRAQLEETLNREVHDAIQEVVREKRLRGVLISGPIVYSKPGTVVDITQDVIDRLK